MTEIDAVPREVKDLFLKLARDVKKSGVRRYSSDAILHRIRWHFTVDMGGREFKCNDNWTACLARWAMEVDPDLAGLFELRERRS